MKKNKKFIALVFFVIAIGLAYMGYSESQGVGSSLAGAISGSPTDSVMFKYISAAVLAVAGLILLKK